MASRAKHVAIFGAGITGLTAAHELIERGYEVEIFEPEEPSPFEKVCAIGGMARTQWARAERPPGPGKPDLRPAGGMVPTDRMPADLERKLEERIEFPEGGVALSAAAREQLVAIAALLCRHPEVRHVEVRGYTDARGARPLAPNPLRDKERAVAVVEHLRRLGVPTELTASGYGLGWPDEWAKSDAERCYVDFHTIEDWIPGEHGFRFFPAFYYNLRDTLGRIPIAEPNGPYRETSRRVLDNVLATTSQGINLKDRDPLVFPRQRVTSIQRMFDVLHDSFRASGFTLRDVALLEVKLFKYLTSSPARRRDYERLSWWDFVEGDRYSEAFQVCLDQTPQTLVAMTAKHCDARTFGTVQAQILLDQFSAGENTDGTLNGPTSRAWFDHWRRYLESQGVIFRNGRLRGFALSGDDTLTPLVDITGNEGAAHGRTALARDYYVVALPLEELHELVSTHPELAGEDFERLRAMQLGDGGRAEPDGVLQHLSGIQYYFRGELKFLRGHVVFADSEWGLSSVFQPQFWTSKRGWWDGYRGVLSVDIGDWYTPSRYTRRAAWDSEATDIAHEVWRQIVQSIPDPERASIETPILFHMDEGIEFGRVEGGRMLPSRNRHRLLINHPGEFARRPGGLEGYQVHFGSLVLAGTYTQTHFRLTTMEAANESARHAVNALLEADGFRGDRCAIVNHEDREFEDFEYFIDLDTELHRQGLPHLVDILGIGELPRSWLLSPPDLSVYGIPILLPWTSY